MKAFDTSARLLRGQKEAGRTPRPVWLRMCEPDGKDRVNMSPIDPLQTSVYSENVIRGQLVGGHFDTCLIFGVRRTICQQWRMVESAWGMTDTLV